MPFVVLFFFMGFVSMLGIGAYSLVGKRPTALPPPRPRRAPSWLAGEDLLRYPRRLSELERQLVVTHGAAEVQRELLESRELELAGKAGRSDLAERYAADARLLERRAAAIRRVLGSVWKTRAILELRVALAIGARQRPDLEHLPQPLSVPKSGLEKAARQYELAAGAVREFMEDLVQRQGSLVDVVPPSPHGADIDEEDRAEIAEERFRISASIGALVDRMDQLADTLDYLSTRFRTQRVVATGEVGVELGPEAGRLLEEVSSALASVDALTAVGDKVLADAAVQELSEDIGHMGRAGQEATAEAEAAAEVERLLESFKAGRMEPAQG